MKRFCFTLLILGGLIGYSGISGPDNIRGSIRGWNDEWIYIYSWNILTGKEECDSTLARNGYFSYALPSNDTLLLKIARRDDLILSSSGYYYPAAYSIEAVLAPGLEIQVEGRILPDGLRYRMEGSQLAQDMAEMRESLFHLLPVEDSLHLALFGRDADNSPENRRKMSGVRFRMQEEKIKTQAAFIWSHWDREASAYYLSQHPYWLVQVYDSLSPEVRNGVFKRKMEYEVNRINAQEARRLALVNKNAPDFTLPDVNGGEFTLSALPGEKYIVLDFWGSWCAPCIAGFPEMKKYYEKYRSKLEIIGIASDRSLDVVNRSVMEHQLPWINLWDNHQVTQAYRIMAFPTKLILSPDKTVLYISRGEEKDFYGKLDDLLGQQH